MQDSRWVGGYLRVQISRRASPKVKAVYSTRVNVEKREKGEKRGIKVSSRGQKRKKRKKEGEEKKKEEERIPRMRTMPEKMVVGDGDGGGGGSRE